MTTTTLIVVIVVLAAAAAVFAYFVQRRAALRKQFGPEYERVVGEVGSPRRAEAALEARARRVTKYDIRALSRDEAIRYSERWRAVQARFVDDPGDAVNQADALVTDLMRTRGYPMSDFDQRAEDVSVDHANVVHHYRQAHAIAVAHGRGTASTEDLRQAVVHYRALFDDLLDVHEPERKRA
jgi:hypothetical protein